MKGVWAAAKALMLPLVQKGRSYLQVPSVHQCSFSACKFRGACAVWHKQLQAVHVQWQPQDVASAGDPGIVVIC